MHEIDFVFKSYLAPILYEVVMDPNTESSPATLLRAYNA